MSTSNVHQEPEPILRTPLFSTSQQSQALLPPTLETDADTLSPSAEHSSTDQLDQHDPIDRKGTDSAFVIRQASTICDSGEPSAPQKEVAAYMQWSLEILVLLFGGAIFTSICLILKGYHEQVLPDWEDLLITLNTLISVLATILRVAIAFVMFEILSQLKWEWLTTCFRPVYHAQLFNAASRGVYGSLRLLPTIIRHEPFAVAAIVIAVLSLGIGSFTQQSIQTYPCWRNASNVGDTTFIKIANTVNKSDLRDSWKAGGKSTRRMNLKMQVTIQDAIVNGVKDYHLAPLFKCSSGNCSFPNDFSYDEHTQYSHASLGVCNSCIDVYKLVKGPTSELFDGTRHAIFEIPMKRKPNWKGHGIRVQTKIVHNATNWPVMTTTTVDDFTWALDLVTPEFLNVAQMSIANFTILTASQSGCKRPMEDNVSCPHDCDSRGESTSKDVKTCLPRQEDSRHSFNPVAATCTLYPCLKYYIANVTDARLTETVVREVPLQLHGRGTRWDMFNVWMDKGNASLAAIQEPCSISGVPNSDDNLPLNSQPDPDAVTNLSKLLNTTAPPKCLFEMPQSLWIGFWNEFRFALNSYCFLMRDRGVQCKVSRSRDEARHPNYGIPSYPAHMAALYHNNNASVQTINDTFNALAERLTAAIRFDGKRSNEDKHAEVKGKLLETKVCVNFVWQWLIYPGVLLVSSTILLGAIVIKDTVEKKAHIWKSSILPILLKDHVGTQNTGLNGLEDVAQGLEIKLQRGNRQRDLL
ncbi:uncharacterized protein B0J16DRAFT_386867 [Fusarium flagelliforme]|uniref:uncharacterized protein n=1 Tax=Fusarium flagelliforme TaxID=2675880 RepID=UPI001E8E56CD|nr:uncharacterized protein B0J16DRAFT_386867 [Fusarium flagelliforme]KAH7179046.1 hypothetical protein B0J16DRAFT_386867 [Fusarium flagelliforme]